MMCIDEDALACDLAETYGIFDYRQHPPTRIAAYSVGLRDDSRIKMKICKQEYSTEMLLLAAAVDRLSLILWAKTKDAEKGKNKPKSILEDLIGNKDKDIKTFASGSEFDDMWARLTGGTNGY